jgi:hypothetical protein
MYCTRVSTTTLLLLWWLGWVVFCGVVDCVFAKAGVVAYVFTKAIFFGSRVLLYLLHLMAVSQANELYGLHSFSPCMIFFSSSCILTWLVVGHLHWKGQFLRVRFPCKCLWLWMFIATFIHSKDSISLAILQLARSSCQILTTIQTSP